MHRRIRGGGAADFDAVAAHGAGSEGQEGMVWEGERRVVPDGEHAEDTAEGERVGSVAQGHRDTGCLPGARVGGTLKSTTLWISWETFDTVRSFE